MTESEDGDQANIALNMSANTPGRIRGPREVINIIVELRQDLNDLIASYVFAASGVGRLHKDLTSAPSVPDNPDPMIHMGLFKVGSADESRLLAQWRMSAARTQVEPGGPVQTKLGHQWIVFFYSLWEHMYRPRLAAARGRAASEERYPLLGDMRKLRNDVVHHHGVATLANTGRCEVLHWFKPGEIMRLNIFHLDEFLREFPWQALADGSHPAP
jgi:hypothetical protein